MTSHLPPEESRRRTIKIWRDVGIWIVLTAVILGLKLGFEHTEFGNDLRILSHKYMLQRLVSNREATSTPIVIVDISEMETEYLSEDKVMYKATPRDKLLNLIQAIAKQNPRAIGVDIDFSPDEHGYMTPDDPEFFKACLTLSNRKENPIPVVLGIGRTEAFAPKYWLAAIAYKDLAASILLPQKDTRKLWEWAKPDAYTVPTMAAALSKSIWEERSGVPQKLAWAAHQSSERDLGHGYLVNEYMVDYSLLDLLESMRVRTTEPAGIEAQNQLLRDKVVIIGNATLGKAMDTFPVPVRQQPVTGVYLHASGAYTLAMSPLYELSSKGRLALDGFLALMIISAITGIRLLFKKEVDVHWLQGALTILVVIIAFVVGLYFVHSTHVMWDDFLLVIFALLLHGPVEKWIGGFWRFLKQDLGPMLERHVFKPKGVRE